LGIIFTFAYNIIGLCRLLLRCWLSILIWGKICHVLFIRRLICISSNFFRFKLQVYMTKLRYRLFWILLNKLSCFRFLLNFICKQVDFCFLQRVAPNYSPTSWNRLLNNLILLDNIWITFGRGHICLTVFAFIWPFVLQLNLLSTFE